ncbi:multicopper oxidase [Xylaria telfairii]|nr:multicopper oxidase [Xylaria telfairii]
MLRRLVSGIALALAVGLPFSLGQPSSVASGKVPRTFDLTVTWEKYAPNGVSRNVILINGQFPGPLIEVNEGDDVLVKVHNKMPFNTTMHFHGIEQVNTPWSDGVPGITQREIKPGASFSYRWKADQYGEYWYHAHHMGQLDDGQFGPLIIHPKKNRASPFSLISRDRDTIQAMEKAAANVKPLMLSDWRQINSYEAWDIETAAGSEIPCYDSLLVNGQGRVKCWTADELASLTTPTMKILLAAGNFTSLTPKGCLPKPVAVSTVNGGVPPKNISAIPSEIFDNCDANNSPNAVVEVSKPSCDQNGTWAAFDVVGTYTLMTATFSIDGLPMWVYAVDGEYIEPQLVKAISVANGDRYSFLVHLTDAGNYTIRHAGTLPIQLISGQATLSYKPEGAPVSNQPPTQYINDAGAALSSDVIFFNQTIQKPYPAFPVGQKADQTYILTLGNIQGSGNIWSMNGTAAPMSLEDGEPVLFMPQPNIMNNLTITTLNNTWVDLIFVVTQFPQPAHPIHKHGNKMWQIGSGHGAFNYSSVAEAIKVIPENFNLVNPPRRDGFATLDAPRGPTWIAVRYHVTNPGVWFLHCHISTHLQSGMALIIQDGVDHFPTVPPEYLSYGK